MEKRRNSIMGNPTKGCCKLLTESQCMKIEKALNEDVEPRKLAAYLCLHMGLTVAEATALRLRDLDLETGILQIKNTLSRSVQLKSKQYDVVETPDGRIIPIPSHVLRILKKHLNFYRDTDCFLINGGHEVPGVHLLQNVLFSINKQYNIADTLTANQLRNVFIRRCIESDIDLYTIGYYVGIRQIGEIQKKFSNYLVPQIMKFSELERYSIDFAPSEQTKETPLKRMNLLILGAGSQGHVVKETAEAIGVFHEIAFLDDDKKNILAIDTCENYQKYGDQYPIAIPSFGNCEIRARWIDRLENAGFILPILIHPMATVSPSATIGAGTVVEMKAIVGTNAKVGKGCIISSGAVVYLDAAVDGYCHIGSSVTVKKGAYVEPFSKVDVGGIVSY